MSLTSKGVHLKTLVSFLEKFAPKSLAETWDNTGLLVEPMSPIPVKNVLLTNDLTEDVVNEAVDLNIELIISYHPPIFEPFKRITTNSWKERVIGSCLEKRIAIYSPHTSWDSVPGGVNDWLAGAFDTKSVYPIIKDDKNPDAGAGRYCELKSDIKLCDAVKNVKTLTSLKFLNVALARGASLDTKINDVAICAGAGSSVLNNIKADLLLTGEMSHHGLLHAIHSGSSVILCNHSNSERGFLKEFALKLKQQFGEGNLNVFVSEKDRDPLQTI